MTSDFEIDADDTVLVVDDHASVREFVQAALKTGPFRVVALASGEEALKFIESERVDLVLLDIAMPGMDGLEVCRRIKSSPKAHVVPVVLLTAFGTAEDVVGGLGAGAEEFLTKPVDAAALRARVTALLRYKKRLARAAADSNRSAEEGKAPDAKLGELVRARVDQLSQVSGLTPREREVLDLLLMGKNAEDISTSLDISIRTVKHHQTNMLSKVGAESRIDLFRILL